MGGVLQDGGTAITSLQGKSLGTVPDLGFKHKCVTLQVQFEKNFTAIIMLCYFVQLW